MLKLPKTLAFATVVVALLLTGASPAQAAVRPGLGPFFPDGKNGVGPREYVTRNLDTQARNLYLRNCLPRYSCYAVGEGDGEHTFFELYYCDDRSLTNFLGRGAAVNNQTSGAVAELRRQGRWLEQSIQPDNRPVSVAWDPIYYIYPC